MMYFVQLMNLKEYDKSFLIRFDQVLKSLHSSSRYFTPEFIKQQLDINLDDSFDLLFKARTIGIVHTVDATKCIKCGKISNKGHLGHCLSCNSQHLKSGYYFTTEAHQHTLN